MKGYMLKGCIHDFVQYSHSYALHRQIKVQV